MATYNKTLGKFQLVGIPPAPRGIPQIEVSFDIDANGIINVSAKDLGTGNEQQIRIEGGSGLKQDEIDRMIKDAEAHAGEAHRLRELADTRNKAEALAYQIEKSLQEHREKLDRAWPRRSRGGSWSCAACSSRATSREIKAKTDALQEAWTQAASGAVRAGVRPQAASGNGGVGGVRRRGRRGRRVRGRRRVTRADERGATQTEETAGRGGRREPVAELTHAARRVPRRAAAAEGRVRQLPQAGGARPAGAGRARPRAAGARAVPVLDDLERALEAATEHEEAKLEDGVRLVHRALADLLAREGLVEVETEGKFDPHSQEALLAQPSEAEEGTVIQVLQKGYRLGDLVVRPARVVVSQGTASGSSDALRDARRPEERVAGRDQEGVPQARARGAPGPQPG